MAWKEWFAEQVPNESLRLELWAIWQSLHRGLSPGKVRKMSELHRDPAWRQWIERALSLHVKVMPNGRAIVRDPLDQSMRVEVQWERVKKWGHVPLSIHVYAEDPRPQSHPPRERPFLAWKQPTDLNLYLAACRIRLDRDQVKRKRLPQSRPSGPGKPASRSFYEGLLDAYDRLVSEGHRAPVQEIATSMNANPSTVKSWLKRGREHLKREV